MADNTHEVKAPYTIAISTTKERRQKRGKDTPPADQIPGNVRISPAKIIWQPYKDQLASPLGMGFIAVKQNKYPRPEKFFRKAYDNALKRDEDENLDDQIVLRLKTGLQITYSFKLLREESIFFAGLPPVSDPKDQIIDIPYNVIPVRNILNLLDSVDPIFPPDLTEKLQLIEEMKEISSFWDLDYDEERAKASNPHANNYMGRMRRFIMAASSHFVYEHAQTNIAINNFFG